MADSVGPTSLADRRVGHRDGLHSRSMDTIALAALVLSTTLSLLLTPDLHLADLIEPTVQATIAAPITMTAILALRLSGARPIWERRLLTAFLLLMPTVYLLSLA